MSLQRMKRRIDQITEAVTSKKHAPTFHLDFDLFSPDEQARFRPLWSKLSTAGSLQVFSDRELDEFKLWIQLYDARENDNQVAADRYRQYLSMTVDEMITSFLALDLDVLPVDHNAAGPMLEDMSGYHFNRANYRYLKINHIDQGKINISTIQDVRRWLIFYDVFTTR